MNIHRFAPTAAILALAAALAWHPNAIEVLAQDVQGPADANTSAKADKAGRVLKARCAGCHFGDYFDVANPKTILEAEPGKKPVVIGRSLKDSRLWEEVDSGRMPKDGPKLPDDEKQTIKEWIESGAQTYRLKADRKPIALKTIFEAIAKDLKKEQRDGKETKKLRYFFTTHLYNNMSIPDDRLPLFDAALSKAINSLHWGSNIVVPDVVEGTKGTLFRIDIGSVEWDRKGLWNEILKQYPYGLRWDKVKDNELRTLDNDIYDLTGSEQAMIRADWFVATATRPPLYHTLLYDAFIDKLRERKIDPAAAKLGNPKKMTAKDLEDELKVNVLENFKDPSLERIARSGFARSQVSAQNRVVERHKAGNGAYWLSYDFKPENPRSRIIRLPLGPYNLYPPGEHPFEKQAFAQDGGEIIFNLPNGMQGYLLIDGKGNRINEGPIDVVGDFLKTSGTAAIVPGVSCMACHKQGMLPLKDEILDGNSQFRFEKEVSTKILALYPERSKMDRLLNEDAERFVEAERKATGVFRKAKNKADGKATKGIAGEQEPIDREEPIGYVARHYRANFMDLEAVACDLFESNPAQVKAKLGENKFVTLGLKPLESNSVISRLDWETIDFESGLSLMQLIAQEFGARALKLKEVSLPVSKDYPAGMKREVPLSPKLKMEFCWVPPGEDVQLGSPESERKVLLNKYANLKGVLEREAATPGRKLTTPGFWLGRFEVTQEQWNAVMDSKPSQRSGDKLPVESVSWDDCQIFLKKLNADKIAAVYGGGSFCLPTEDEWEYACRGGEVAQSFHVGETLGKDQANFNDSALKMTTVVGQYEKQAHHPWGLCDMHGNVMEWTDSSYCDGKVVRGGSFTSQDWQCRTAYRMSLNQPVDDVGFRVCIRPKP